jgi:acyl transferase domain-containing protein
MHLYSHAYFHCLRLTRAGTSLGDPIEVGAALAVYSEAPRQQPLALAASKSWVGHAEPAAGLAGLLFAHATATQALSLPLLHLRAVNPYVASTLEQQQQQQKGSSGGAVAPALLPKQGGALPAAEARETSTWGVSAFAFQGTNAHAVLAAVSGSSSSVAVQLEQLPAWQGKRQYVLPEAHLLITAATVSAAGASRRVLFHAELAAASLAFLWDHQVMGKGIFPGEASAACCA